MTSGAFEATPKPSASGVGRMADATSIQLSAKVLSKTSEAFGHDLFRALQVG